MPRELETLVHYQTSLFTALVGVLAAKGIVSREEMAAALEVVAHVEPDIVARRLLTLLAESLLDEHATAEETARFQVILGGLHGIRSSD